MKTIYRHSRSMDINDQEREQQDSYDKGLSAVWIEQPIETERIKKLCALQSYETRLITADHRTLEATLACLPYRVINTSILHQGTMI